MARTDEPLTPDRPPSADPASFIQEAPSPAPDEKRVAVRVAEGTQVNLDGRLYGAGETLQAPHSLAEAWLAWGWVRTVQPKRRS